MFYTVTYHTHDGEQSEVTVEASDEDHAIAQADDDDDCAYALGVESATEAEIQALLNEREDDAMRARAYATRDATRARLGLIPDEHDRVDLSQLRQKTSE